MRSKVTQLINEFKGLNTEEQALFLDFVDPLPEVKAKTRAKKKVAATGQRRGLGSSPLSPSSAAQPAGATSSPKPSSASAPAASTATLVDDAGDAREQAAAGD